jgi:hypothetical protein
VVDAVSPPSESELEIDRSMAEALLAIVRGGSSGNSSSALFLKSIHRLMPWTSIEEEVSSEEHQKILAAGIPNAYVVVAETKNDDEEVNQDQKAEE